MSGRLPILSPPRSIKSSEEIAEEMASGGPSLSNIAVVHRTCGTLFVDSYCSVYELAAGEHFDVQHNPRGPRQYVCKEATWVFLKGSFIALCLLVMGILYALSCQVFGR